MDLAAHLVDLKPLCKPNRLCVKVIVIRHNHVRTRFAEPRQLEGKECFKAGEKFGAGEGCTQITGTEVDFKHCLEYCQRLLRKTSLRDVKCVV